MSKTYSLHISWHNKKAIIEYGSLYFLFHCLVSFLLIYSCARSYVFVEISKNLIIVAKVSNIKIYSYHNKDKLNFEKYYMSICNI